MKIIGRAEWLTIIDKEKKHNVAREKSQGDRVLAFLLGSAIVLFCMYLVMGLGGIGFVLLLLLGVGLIGSAFEEK